MEAKANILLDNSSIIRTGSKKVSFNGNKGFNSPIKSNMKDNKEENQFQAKVEKIMKNKENKLEKDVKSLKYKKQVEDLENPEREEKDLPINYEDKYNLFLNVFQKISEFDKNDDLTVDEDISILNLESLLTLKPDEIENIHILEKDSSVSISELKINEIENQGLLVDEEGLEIDIGLKLDVDRSKSMKVIDEESEINPKLSMTNENLELDDDGVEMSTNEDNKLILNDITSNDEDSKDFSESQGFKEPNVKEINEDSGIKIKEKTNIQDKINFTLEKQEVKIDGMPNLEMEDNQPIDKNQFMNHILEKVKFDLSNNKNQIKVTLKPESLGEMIMEVEVVKNTLVAKIMVDNHRAKEIIENNLFQLKEGIKDTGLEIKTFEVFVGKNSDFDKHNSNQFNFNGRNKKIKLKKEIEDKKIGLYEDNIKMDAKNPIYLSSGTSLNLFA